MTGLVEVRVRQILGDTPGARGSDDVLIFEYTRRYCGRALNLRLFGVSHHDLRTINRVRQQLQKDVPGLRPKLERLVERHVLAEEWRESYAHN